METVGSGNTVMVTEPLNGCVQLGVPALETLTSAMTVVDAYVPEIVAVPDAFSVTVWFGLTPI
jgi:hypothetical protein